MLDTPKTTGYDIPMHSGDCLVPENIETLPPLSVASNFVCTNWLDYRNFYLPTKNQGNTPRCAAYSCSSFVESILWRKNNAPAFLDPSKLYDYAKTIDGMNGGSGTTLTSIAEGVYHYGLLEGDKSNIRVIQSSANALQELKFALFKYGGCLIGMNITDEYYIRENEIYCNTVFGKKFIHGLDKFKPIGGHAMVLVGFDDTFFAEDFTNGIKYTGAFTVLNSWGKDWGDNGYCTIPYSTFMKQFLYGVVFKNCLNNLE